MIAVRLLAGFGLVSLLAACGGGGGGSTNDASLSIGRVTPAAVSMSVSDLQYLSRTVSLEASYAGTASGMVYVVVEDPDAVFAGGDVSIGGSRATLTLSVGSEVQPGHYTRPMTLHVCLDAGCAREAAGSPQTVGKDVTVDGIRLGAQSLAFSASGGVAPAAQGFSVATPGGVAYGVGVAASYVSYVSPTGDQSYLGLSEVFAVTSEPNRLSLQPLGSAPGRYTMDLLVTADGYADRPVHVSYDVGPVTSPVFTLPATPIAVSGPAVDADVEILLDGVLDMPASKVMFAIDISGTPDPKSTLWLRYYDSFLGLGSDGRGMRHRLYANACFAGISCLAPGTYHAQVKLTGTAFGQSTEVTVPVSFTVTAP